MTNCAGYDTGMIVVDHTVELLPFVRQKDESMHVAAQKSKLPD
jgi:hypothetical protein